MSIQTWLDEFMPKKPTKRMTKRQAVEHSLRKWEGLTKKNLKKHGVSVGWKKIRDDEWNEFGINDESCALCIKYRKNENCGKCPLAQTLGGKSCDDFDMPYAVWALGDCVNPLPMIKALRKTLENLED